MIKMTQILNELQGVSFESRVWGPIIRRLIDGAPKTIPRGNFVYANIDGYDYPTEHRQFPLDNIEIKIIKSDNDDGSYTPGLSGYDKDTEYKAFITLSTSASDTTIYHELKHAYEDFRKKENKANYPPRKKDYNQGDFSKLIQSNKLTEYGIFGFLMWGIYYFSDEEVAARIEEIYTNPDSANRIIRMSNNILNEYITDDFKNKTGNYFEQDLYYDKINREYNIPILKKYGNFIDFVKWAQNEIRYDGQRALKRFLKVKYLAQITNRTVNPN